MKPEEVIEMAFNTELICDDGTSRWVEDHNLIPYIEAFAKLVAAKERKRIIEVLKALDTQCNEDGGYDEPSRDHCIWAIKGEI